MIEKRKVRIKLRSADHRLLDRWVKEIIEIAGEKTIVNMSVIKDLVFLIKKKTTEEFCIMEVYFGGMYLGSKKYEKIRLAKIATLTMGRRCAGALNQVDIEKIETRS